MSVFFIPKILTIYIIHALAWFTYVEETILVPSLYQEYVGAGSATALQCNVPFPSMSMLFFVGGGVSAVHRGGTRQRCVEPD